MLFIWAITNIRLLHLVIKALRSVKYVNLVYTHILAITNNYDKI
jgi:hypothetical protein